MMVAPNKRITARTAIVHDWLPVIGGAERVLSEMVKCCSSAEIFTIFDFLSSTERDELLGPTPVHASVLNGLPHVAHYYRNLLLVATRAIESFDVSKFDLVISSSAALAKGVITTSRQKHIAYTHSTTRYAWDLTHDYLSSISGTFAPLRRLIAREMLHRYRLWDMRTVASVDHFVANSRFTQERIWKFYRREAEVIYPPVDVSRFSLPTAPSEDFYLSISRLVPYKRIDLIVEAFAQSPSRRLVVIGDGPEMKRLRQLKTPNIILLGHQDEPTVVDYMQRCRAFIFSAFEDFGIAPVEAQACGKPVIALNKGGAVETIRGLKQSRPTGVLFENPTVEALLGALDRFEECAPDILANNCRRQALRFSAQTFQQNFSTHIEELTSLPVAKLQVPA